jgi:hypothetical protein
MKRESRVIMHEHLKAVLTSFIADQLGTLSPGKFGPPIPIDLVARHVASTFVLVLNWWVESDVHWTAADADARFRRLIVPALTGLVSDVG